MAGRASAGGKGPYRSGERPSGRFWPRRLRLGLCACAAISASAGLAQSNNVRITNLTDVSFGTVTDFGTDATSSQSVCVFAHTASSGYWITATGSGAGGDFWLDSGGAPMPYDVLWGAAPGQAGGTQLSPNVPLTGQFSSAQHQTCRNGPAASASLTVVLRASALASATAGSYGGALTLIVGPE